VESGVQQGYVLGHSLFLFYINDMAVGIRSSVRLFADDTIACLAVTSEVGQLKLQEDLNKPAIWEPKWKKTLHPEKCNVLTISRKFKPIKHKYTLHGHILKSVEVTKYLACHIISYLTWSEHISKTYNKANSALGFLRRNLHSASTTANGKFI